MKTNGDIWREIAEQRGIPLRTLEQVQTTINEAKETQADSSFARLMLRNGRLTSEAREWLAKEYPQCAC